MYKIAICDDNTYTLNEITETALEFGTDKNLQV